MLGTRGGYGHLAGLRPLAGRLFERGWRAAVAIAHHDAEALAKWDAFAASYDNAMEEVIRSNRLSHNTALLLRDSMIAYGRAIKLDDGALSKIEAALGAYCDLNIPE